jgi:hypothetical protein
VPNFLGGYFRHVSNKPKPDTLLQEAHTFPMISLCYDCPDERRDCFDMSIEWMFIAQEWRAKGQIWPVEGYVASKVSKCGTGCKSIADCSNKISPIYPRTQD